MLLWCNEACCNFTEFNETALIYFLILVHKIFPFPGIQITSQTVQIKIQARISGFSTILLCSVPFAVLELFFNSNNNNNIKA